MTDQDTRGDDSELEDDPDEPIDRTYLEAVEDGAGCTEIWERLAERREE